MNQMQGTLKSQSNAWGKHITFPSYSRLERTSGAIYAGVPTVDLGREWSKDDYIANKKHSENYNSNIKYYLELLSSMILIIIPSNNQSHKFLSGVQDFHLKGYFLASDLCGIFAVKRRLKA